MATTREERDTRKKDEIGQAGKKRERKKGKTTAPDRGWTRRKAAARGIFPGVALTNAE